MPDRRSDRDMRAPALAVLAAWFGLAAAPAHADRAKLEQDLAALRAEVERLLTRVAELEAEQRRLADAPSASTPPDPKTETRADTVKTPGIGAPSVRLRARVQFDGYHFDGDTRGAIGGMELRRARAQADGKFGSWAFRLQGEFAGREVDVRDAYLKREVGATQWMLGQFKPYRSMDELTSFSDVSLLERSFVSGTGMFSGRQWQQGLGVSRVLPAGTLGASLVSLRNTLSPRNEGWGFASRGTWTPLLAEPHLLHLGGWVSIERGGAGTPALPVDAAFGGRRGPSARLLLGDAGDGVHYDAFGLEWAGRYGSLHWQAEAARGWSDAPQASARIDAHYAQLGWVFGGLRGYDAGKGLFTSVAEPGAMELLARYDRIEVERGLKPGAERWVLGFNWYVTEPVRLSLNWTTGRELGSDRPARQWALRAQYVF